MEWRTAWVCLAIVVWLSPRGVHADQCEVIRGGASSLGQLDAAERLHFIQGELRSSARKARMWTWGWVMANGTLSGAQLALLPAYTPERKVDLYVGSGTAFVAMVGIAALPLKVMSDQRWLDRRIRDAPPGSDPCALLADAERLLIRDAADQDPRQRWLLHAANLALNVGAGLILGLAFDRWTSAFINTAAGIAIGEATVLTRPTSAYSALSRYRSGRLGVPAKADSIHWNASAQLERDRYLVRLGFTF